MYKKLAFTFLLVLFLKAEVKSQDTEQSEKYKVTIAGKFHGEITREELLNAGELKLNKELSEFHIISFEMVLGSGPDSLLFFTNKRNGELTDEMKGEISGTKKKYDLFFMQIICANKNGASLKLNNVELQFIVRAINRSN